MGSNLELQPQQSFDRPPFKRKQSLNLLISQLGSMHRLTLMSPVLSLTHNLRLSHTPTSRPRTHRVRWPFLDRSLRHLRVCPVESLVGLAVQYKSKLVCLPALLKKGKKQKRTRKLDQEK